MLFNRSGSIERFLLYDVMSEAVPPHICLDKTEGFVIYYGLKEERPGLW